MDLFEDDSAELRNVRPGKRPGHYRIGVKATGKISRKYHGVYGTYHYDVLPRAHGIIRILELYPSELPDAGVRCALINPDENERHRYPYEALSWCWGTANKTDPIQIHRNGKPYLKFVSPNLVAAIKALRYPYHSRYLWIDMICIDQDDLNEKNHQVEMMDIIYRNAERVCIWLGAASQSSHVAIQFIRKEVSRLQSFDALCDSKEASQKWLALLELMQRPWFSRRWVIQELAFARDSVIHCGTDHVSWKNFAIAVELFMEAETSTRRLSEAMKAEQAYRRTPNYFDHVSELGASLLVNATERLFRDYKTFDANQPGAGANSLFETWTDSDSDVLSDASGYESSNSWTSHYRIPTNNVHSGPKTRVQPLLSLEYLVSSLTIFDTTVPHDTIYALLALAKDTMPRAVSARAAVTSRGAQEGLEVYTQRKSYNVNYKLPYVDVCKDFIQFSIERSLDGNSSRALDVICRPWAIEEKKLEKLREAKKYREETERKEKMREKDLEARRMKHQMREEHLYRSHPFDLPESASVQDVAANAEREDMALPSWVPQLSNAPYAIAQRPGLTGPKMSRINADPLVGLPSPSQPNYSAAGATAIDMKVLRFRKQSTAGRYSMYVRGFQLDVIAEVTQEARHGQIPSEWTELVRWEDAKGHPPEAFWRTLVANRGIDGKSAPAYYSRACEESFRKGGIRAGAVDTTGLIELERNSIITQFCRRMQAVTWNRLLGRTTAWRLVLASKGVGKGDIICILYGCSVPVVLRRSPRKTEEEFDIEIEHELVSAKRTVVKNFAQSIMRKRRHRFRIDKEMSKLCRTWLKTTHYFRSHAFGPPKSSAKDTREVFVSTLMQAITDFRTWLVEERKKSWLKTESYILKEMREREGNSKKKLSEPDKSEIVEHLHRQTEARVSRKRKDETAANVSRKRRQAQPVADMLEMAPSAPVTARSADFDALKDMPSIAKKKKPSVDWWEFEYALVAGRRWKQVVKQRREAREEAWKQELLDQYQTLKNKRAKQEQGNTVEVPANEGADTEGDSVTHDQQAVSGEHTTNKELESNDTMVRDGEHGSSRGDETVRSNGDNGGPAENGEHVYTEKREETGKEGNANSGDHETKDELLRNGERPLADISSTSSAARALPDSPAKIRPSWRREVNRTRLTPGEILGYDRKIRNNLRERLGEEGYYSYTLLGECYVHGMMDGEAMQLQSEDAEGVIPSMVFEIR